MKSSGAFRLTYFTEKYNETIAFYKDEMELEVLHVWDRHDNDKGTLLKAGVGTIEVMLTPNDEHRVKGLDYRKPQGVFACLQVDNASELYEKYKKKNIEFKEDLVDQSWGHRSFSVVDPNGIVLFLFEELF